MKGPFRNKQGSSLLEVVVAIAVLGLMVAPVCSSLVLSHRLNAEADKVLRARLLVESTVEQLMFEGIAFEKNADGTFAKDGEGEYIMSNDLPDGVTAETNFQPQDVIDETTNQKTGEINTQLWYNVKVAVEDVEIATVIKAAPVYTETIVREGGGNG